MRKKRGITLKYLDVQASTATMNKHRHSRCHYKRNFGSTPTGMNNLHIGGPAGRQTPGGSPPTTAAASTTSVSDGKTATATASGQTLLQEVPRPRPHTRGEDKPPRPKSRRSDRRWHRRSRRRRNLLWLPHLSTDDGSHLPTNTAPASTGSSSLLSSPQERERDHLRTRVPLSRRTTCCATPRCSRPQSPGRRTECCTLARQQQFAFPRMAGGRLLHRAGGWFPPPDAGGRSGSPSHAKAGPGSPRPPTQKE
jgi:hypothetical protein